MRYVGRLPRNRAHGRARGGSKKLGYTNEIFIDAVNRFVSASAGTAGAVHRLKGDLDLHVSYLQ